MIIYVASDFSMTPGGRYKKDGEYSGEEFREKILKPSFLKCREKGEELTVDLDGGYGYGSSFLDESFGGLGRELRDKRILDIRIISEEEPELVEQIRDYIESGLKIGM